MADPVLGPVADGDSFKVIFFQSLYNQRIMNVLHYVCADPGATPPDRYQICKDLIDFLDSGTNVVHDMQTLQSGAVKWTALRCQFLKEIDATYPFFEKPVTSSGTLSGAAGTANIALSIEKRAVFDPGHPRQGIGRLAVAGPPQTSYSAGVFDPTYLASANSLLEDLVDSITLDGDVVMKPCLVHKGALNWIDNEIFGTSVKDTVRDMTRRTVGRGE